MPHLRTAALPHRRTAAGFTLIELMVVMVIIILLAGIGLVVYGNSVQRAKEATLKTNLLGMREAIDQYYADKNTYPPTLDALVTEKYIRTVPVDPMTGAADWRTEMAPPDPSNPSGEIGVYDVRSASDQVSSLDGTPYAEW